MMNSPIPEAAGRAAFHCDELLSRAPSPDELGVEFGRFVGGLAEHAQSQLSELCDDRGLQAEIAASEAVSMEDWTAKIGAPHRHSFFPIGKQQQGVLVSISVGELVAQFERILGGTGEVDPECAVIPASALRFAEQFEDRMATTLAHATDGLTLAASGNGEDVAEVAPFDPAGRVWTATLMVSSANSEQSWQVHFAMCEATVANVAGAPSGSPASHRSIGSMGLEGSVISEVDLPLRAILVDVPMSVARLASLTPGSVIPVAVNRNVPLLTGKFKIAQGSVGELDDRVALELNQTFLTE